MAETIGYPGCSKREHASHDENRNAAYLCSCRGVMLNDVREMHYPVNRGGLVFTSSFIIVGIKNCKGVLAAAVNGRFQITYRARIAGIDDPHVHEDCHLISA